MDDRNMNDEQRQSEELDASRTQAVPGVYASPDEQPAESGLPAEAPIPQLPDDALPQEPQQAVPVPENAMPGTDENGDPVEQPAENGSPESGLMTEQPDQPVPSPDSEQ